MKVEIKFTLNTSEMIDLSEYGYDEDAKWDDLTEDEQTEILDPLREALVTDIMYNSYDIEEE